MSMHFWIAFTAMLCVQQSPPALEIPLHPTEARIVEQIIAVEGYTVELAEVPGWAQRGVVNRLKEAGVATEGLRTWGVRDTKMNAVSFSCVYDANGRVLALFGNGPWLRDQSLRALKGMSELRSIRFDHNGFLKQHPLSPLYSGKGFDVLADSKLMDIKLTLGISDAGMEQAANIRG